MKNMVMSVPRKMTAAIGFHGELPSSHAFGKIVDIAVYDDYVVVDSHSERHDNGGKRHGVQLQVEHIEQSQGDEDCDLKSKEK